jgi:hypothetical protein
MTSTFFTQDPAPMLLSHVPDSDAVDVSVVTPLHLSFNKPAINIASTFHVEDTLGSTVPVELIADPLSTPSLPQFNLRYQLAPNTTYTATIDAGLFDDANHATSVPSAWSFTTGLDDIGPRIHARTPARNAVNVTVNSTIELDFDEAALNVVDGSILLETSAGVPVSATLTYDAITAIALLRPDAQLAELTAYKVRYADTTMIEDAFGNPAPFDQWTFMTGTDVVPPQIRATSPPAASTGAPTTGPIVITFDEPTTGLTPSTVTVLVEPGTIIPGALASSSGDRVWTFTPDAPLPALTEISVDLALVRDLHDNVTSYFYNFTTGP